MDLFESISWTLFGNISMDLFGNMSVDYLEAYLALFEAYHGPYLKHIYGPI
jgi:hypothetical protein